MISVAISLKLLVFFIFLSSTVSISAHQSNEAVQSLRSAFGIDKLSPDAAPVRKRLRPVDKTLSKLVQTFRAALKEEGMEDLVDVFVDQEDLVINFSDKLLFPSGSAETHQQAGPLLNKLGPLIGASGRDIRVEGHTDNVPIATVRYPSNWELSAARASTLLRYLSERWKVSGERLTAIGFGEYQPIAPNHTAENRAKNRRVTIILLGEKKTDVQENG